MPIQFQCPHCKHAMQLPDAAAGKQGKCPKCSNAVTVPAAQPAAPPNPHDEEFWSEVGEKKEAAPAEVDAHSPVKKSDAQILKHILGKAEAAKVIVRIGVPWERPKEGTMMDRFWDTAIGVMNHTTDTFAEMKVTGGTGSPLKFLLVGATLGSIIAAVYGLVGNAISVFSDGEAEVTVTLVLVMVALFFGTFIGGIIGGLIHVYLQAAGLLLALPMVGVKETSFEKNFRVAAFTNGSIYLCNIVPGLGAGFMLFLWFNGMIKGIESVYEISTNKAALAVLIIALPLVFPIAGVVGFFALVMMGYI